MGPCALKGDCHLVEAGDDHNADDIEDEKYIVGNLHTHEAILALKLELEC